MKHLRCSGSLLLVLGVSLLPVGAAVNPTVEEQVLAAEDAYIAAEIARDEAKLNELVDDAFVHNLSDGTTRGKAALIQSILGMPMVGQDTRERTVHVEGKVALVFGTADIHFAPPNSERVTHSLRYTATYVNRAGSWRMLALQMQARD